MFAHNESYLISLFIQALLYGIYIATLIHCLRLRLFTEDGWKLREKINWLMTITTFLVFLLSTFNIGAVLGFVLQIIRKEIMMGPWVNIGDLLNTSSACLAYFLVDVILIYRCWLVYNKSWRVVSLPILFWFGSMTFAILGAYYNQIHDNHPKNSKTKVYADQMAIAFFGSTIVTNIYATCAIIYRIFRVAKSSNNASKRLYNTILILAESGIMLLSSSVFTLIGMSLDSIFLNDITLILTCVADPINFSMAGITFNLITIRIYESQLDSFGSSGSREGWMSSPHSLSMQPSPPPHLLKLNFQHLGQPTCPSFGR